MTGRIDKAALLGIVAEAEKDATASLIPPLPAQPDVVTAFSLAHGLDRSFTHLVVALAMNKVDYWRQVFERLPADADTAAVVRQWVIWIWSDPEIGLRGRISDPTLLGRADAIIDMHRRTTSAAGPTSREWRQARSAIAKVQTGDKLEIAAAEGAAAAAWNLDDVPAAAEDLIFALRHVMFVEIDKALDWNELKAAAAAEREGAMMAAANACAEAVVASLGGADKARTPEEEAALRQQAGDAFEKGMQEYTAANPSDLDRHGQLCVNAWSQVYDLGREGLLRQLEIAATSLVGAG